MRPTPEARRLGTAVGRTLGGSWAVAPLAGTTGRTFLAAGDRTVVVRLDAAAAVLRRVAELGVGPRVVAQGRFEDRPFVIQEHVPAEPASARWVAANILTVARLICTYAADPDLARLGEPLLPDAYARELLEAAHAARLSAPRLRAVQGLAAAAGTLGPADLVASHGDPNTGNILRADRPMLVDWDDLRAADPMRDLGQIAWWYLPELDWRGFIEAAGQPWDEGTLDRLYWWVAAESLDVGLRLLPVDAVAAEHFLLDFDAASARRGNPRRS